MYQVYVYLIGGPGLDALLHDARGTDADVLTDCIQGRARMSSVPRSAYRSER